MICNMSGYLLGQDYASNRVEIVETIETTADNTMAGKRKKEYDFLPSDRFWNTHKGRFGHKFYLLFWGYVICRW